MYISEHFIISNVFFTARVYADMGLVYIKLGKGKRDDAVKCFKMANARTPKTPPNEFKAILLLDIGASYMMMEQLKDAVAFLNSAKDMFCKLLLLH